MDITTRRTIIDHLGRHHKTSSPFLICDLRKVSEIYDKWRNILPDVKPFYSVKTCPDPGLLRHLAKLDCNFDCASQREIQQILELDVAPSRIIFAHPIKTSEAIVFARDHGIDLMTFDDTCELYKIRKLHPGARLVLRIKTENTESVVDLNLKFGASKASVNAIVRTAQSLGLNCVGISFHVGSGTSASEPYQMAIKLAREIFDDNEHEGLKAEVLDIGGGYTPEGFADTSVAIAKSLSQHFPSAAHTLCSEPGRLFCQDAFTLVCNVIGIKKPTDPGDTNHLYQSDGVWQSFANAVYERTIFRPTHLVRNHGDHLDTISFSPGPHRYVIWGPSCDSLDRLSMEFTSHVEIEMDDWLVYEKMGAYTMACATDFNGIDRPKVVTYLR